MTPIRPTPLLLLITHVLPACGPTKALIGAEDEIGSEDESGTDGDTNGETDADADSDADSDADADADSDADADTDADSDADSDSDSDVDSWEGDYAGDLWFYFQGDDSNLCEGFMNIDINGSNNLDGEGVCVIDANNYEITLVVLVEGDIDSDGNASGETTIESDDLPGGGPQPTDFEGGIDASGLWLEWRFLTQDDDYIIGESWVEKE